MIKNKYVKIRIPYKKEKAPYKPDINTLRDIIDRNYSVMQKVCDTFNVPPFIPFSFMCYYEIDMYDIPSPMSVTARFKDLLDKKQKDLLYETIKGRMIKEYNYITLCLYIIEKINDFNVVDENNNLNMIKLFLSVIYPYSYGKKTILSKYDEFTIFNSIKEDSIIEDIMYFVGKDGVVDTVYNILK